MLEIRPVELMAQGRGPWMVASFALGCSWGRRANEGEAVGRCLMPDRTGDLTAALLLLPFRSRASTP